VVVAAGRAPSASAALATSPHHDAVGHWCHGRGLLLDVRLGLSDLLAQVDAPHGSVAFSSRRPRPNER
jgi:hypothetical protein